MADVTDWNWATLNDDFPVWRPASGEPANLPKCLTELTLTESVNLTAFNWSNAILTGYEAWAPLIASYLFVNFKE